MNERLRARALVPGDRVAVVAPAGPYAPAALEDGLAVLEAMGWRPELIGPGAPAEQAYLAAADSERVASLGRALGDPELRAVFCARGGYGSTRILEALRVADFRRDPKPLVGFSDVTALLSWSAETAGVVAVHGPVVTQLARLDAPSQAALGALLGGHVRRDWPLLSGLRALRGGESEGILRGGNLSLVAALAGTPWAVPLAGSVLLLEDVAEPPYRLDRLLTQLRQQPGWSELRGIVLGDFTGEADEDALEALRREVAARASCPVLAGAPVGHGRRNVALPIGATVRLSGEAGAVTLVDEAVFTARPRSAFARPGGALVSHSAAAAAEDPIDSLLERALVDGPGSALALSVHSVGARALRRQLGCGSLAEQVPLSAQARFDLASLTKAMATGTIAMRAVAQGWLALDDPLPRHLPAFAGRPGWEAVTVRHLLQHSAGLPDWAPLFALARRRHPEAPPGGDEVRGVFREALLALEPEGEPGRVVRYSDLGYLVLGAALEAAGGAPLGTLFRREVASPLRLQHAGYRPVSDWSPRAPGRAAEAFVATEDCPWRGGVVQGVVHDENAHALGGVAPHAGLFASLDDVARWAVALLDASRGRSNPLALSGEVVRAFWDAPPVGDSPWALAWEHPTPGASSAGEYFGPSAVGHLGFTGVSVWIERERELVVVLLTNAVHLTRHQRALKALRPRLHDLVSLTTGEESDRIPRR